MKTTFPPKPKKERQHASALLLVVWAMMIMGVTVMAVIELTDFTVRESVLSQAEYRALLLAESGLAIAVHPNIRRSDNILRQKVGPDAGFDVRISYEGARIPINFLRDTRLPPILRRLFVRWGLSEPQAAIVVDSLIDWVDTDNEPRPNGAERDYYEALGNAELPRQRGFISVNEMLQVRGMHWVDQLRPDWRDYFTVYGEGVIDLRSASREVLLAVTDSSPNDVDRYIRERDGADGIQGTEDDQRIADGTAFNMLGLSGAQASALSSILTSSDNTRRITSTGYVGERRAQIIIIARRDPETRALTYLARMEES